MKVTSFKQKSDCTKKTKNLELHSIHKDKLCIYLTALLAEFFFNLKVNYNYLSFKVKTKVSKPKYR